MTQHQKLSVETFTNGPFGENCFIAADEETKKAILIDPGDEETRLFDLIKEQGWDVQEILCTHAHIDHAGAVAPLKRLLGVPFALHPEDRPVLEHMPMAATMFGLPTKEVPEIDRELIPGETIIVGNLTAEVIFTPGHSGGGCCFYFAEQGVVFVGDTLFAGSVGRTDLPGGNTETLLTSIREQLLILDDAVVAYSGHGPATTIGVERVSNPFLQPGGAIF